MDLRMRIGMMSLKMVPEGKSSSWYIQRAQLMDLKMQIATMVLQGQIATMIVSMSREEKFSSSSVHEALWDLGLKIATLKSKTANLNLKKAADSFGS
jgi:hypothetical protein